MKSTWLTCIQCDDLFEFTATEQDRYDRLGFDAPRRCPNCRRHKFKASPVPQGKRFKEKRKPGRIRHHEDGDGLY